MQGQGHDEGPTSEEIRRNWQLAKADIRTSAMDFPIASLERIFEQGDLVIPSFARRKVWTLSQNSQFLESLLLNIPVPSLFFAEDPDTYKYSVLDGTQRLDAVLSYIKGEYPLQGLVGLHSANGLKFSELPEQMRRHLLACTMRAVIVAASSTSDVTTEVFSRINAGGTHLTTQEIRNAAHQGPFNSLTIELASSDEFRRALGVSSGGIKIIRDAELVLRYFWLTEDTVDSMPSPQLLTHYLQRKNESSLEVIQEYRASFATTLDKCLIAFEGEVFRRWLPVQGKAESRISAPLYYAQMLAVRTLSASMIAQNSTRIRLGMRELFGNPEFRGTFTAAGKHHLAMRVNLIVEMIESVAR
ncbi:DUF262 domain-containing protein [Streptomyces sp. OR43]|uniref:DUF262 domain-containing protein n=1 Tax=Streptomyces sp. or43 TaxID=2478957 RepID=UPI0011CE382F|nr:DUF262 domain-containing protein [Streptomyces sp. or43]TXS36649.1 DUF262 domain-containing protein [Streptomyces sp. or43]